MSLMLTTAESLTRDLGKEVPSIYVIVAKHSVLGMDSESIKDVLGCTLEDVQEVEQNELYKEVRVHIGAAHAQSRVDQTTGWDHIEGLAIQKLAERLPYEKDGDFLLRVAAVANKAQRRQGVQDGVLDPSRQNGRTAITLTERLIQRLTQSGEREQVQERTLSISDGSMKTATFDEVDEVLSVSRNNPLPLRVQIEHQSVEPSFEELDQAMAAKGF